MPDKVKLPLPAFTSEPPLPEITPEKAVLLLLSPPVISAPSPKVTLPAPVSEPMVSSWPARSRVAPSETVWAEAAERLLSAPACRVPCSTCVAPV